MPQVSAVSGYHNHIGATGIQGGLPRKDIEKMIQTPEGAALVKMWMQRFILPENRSSAHSRTPSPVMVKSEPLDDHYDEPLDEPMELTTKRASSPESYESPLRCIQNMSIGSVSPGDQSPRSTEDLDEERQPKVNSHGKVKLNKCRQCKFVASSKTVYWEHIIQHMNPDKILRCPSCPFVTEYKHHLEYHLNNHNGAKPYKCDQCDYSCVNKSMLNSHLKSHSQVYQYRCNDCHYVAKYCHSFKMHLRKYNHTPSVVLNPDGTENPQQIIDVYGTRRGPKQKQMKQVNSVISPPQEHLPPRPNLPLAYNPFMFNHFMLPHLLGMFPAPFPAGMPLNLNIQESAQQHFEHNNSFNSPQKRNDSLSPIRNDSDSESTDEETVKNENLQNNNNVLSCPHCGISFINKDMYVFHMSFHDSQNPLKCHKCSIICKDSVDFFRHLTAVPH